MIGESVGVRSSFAISREAIKEMKAGNLFKIPAEAKLKPSKKSPGETDANWREVLSFQDYARSEDGGTEVLRLQFVVPADVVSENQGRVASEFLRFPHEAAGEGDSGAQKGLAISLQTLWAFLKAVGFDRDFERLSDIPFDSFRNIRVDAQYAIEHDDKGSAWARIRGFRAPK